MDKEGSLNACAPCTLGIEAEDIAMLHQMAYMREKINAMLDFANAYNVPWVDLRSKTSFADSADTLLQGDGLHPTTEGCRIIAEVLSKEIGQRVGRLPE